MVCRNGLIWAALLLVGALAAKASGMSDSVQFAMLAGLSGAAIANLSRAPRTCGPL